jgi:peptidyl-prolyl cis-trans isomerase C
MLPASPLPGSLIALALLAGAGGCGGTRRAPESQHAAIVAVSSSPVVAVVNGAPLPGSDLVLQMRSGQQADEALRALVREELLVQEAARRGLDRDPRVIDMQRRAMVELLVRRQFHDELGLQQIPRRLVEQAYQKNRSHFQRPEAVEVSHFLALAKPKDSPEKREAARRLAERVRALATARALTPDEFLALEKPIKTEAGAIPTRFETLTTPLRGYTVDAFADAAFALARPGAVSPVVPTRFGYHVIYLRKRIPGVDIPLERAEAEIRGRILEEARTQLLMEFTDSLEKRLGVQLMPESLPEARGEGGR